MKYSKPELLGYSAITGIREVGNPPPTKLTGDNEMNTSFPTDPAYQADE